MALFRNSPPASGQVSVNRRNCLCGVHEYASAQSLDFLELAENCTFLDRKLISALYETADGHKLTAKFCVILEVIYPQTPSFGRGRNLPFLNGHLKIWKQKRKKGASSFGGC